jgi:hypothetical protein
MKSEFIKCFFFSFQLCVLIMAPHAMDLKARDVKEQIGTNVPIMASLGMNDFTL